MSLGLALLFAAAAVALVVFSLFATPPYLVVAVYFPNGSLAPHSHVVLYSGGKAVWCTNADAVGEAFVPGSVLAKAEGAQLSCCDATIVAVYDSSNALYIGQTELDQGGGPKLVSVTLRQAPGSAKTC